MSSTATAFGDIEVGRRFPPRPWLVDGVGLDAGLDEYEQWHERFAFADGTGRRIVPPVLLASSSVAANPYDFPGIAAGAESHSTAEWTDAGGTLVHVHRWPQVVSLLARTPAAARPTPRDITGRAAEELDQHPHVPPPVSPRADAEWSRERLLASVDGPALPFDVRAENQRGETVLAGTADVRRTAGAA